MARFDVAGTAPQDAPTIKQDAAWLPSLMTFVGVPLTQAAVMGVGLALLAFLVVAGAIVLLDLHATARAWGLAGLGAAVIAVGVIVHQFPARRQEVLDGWYKRELRDGRDYTGDGQIGAPRDPIPARSQGKSPADARGEARRALLRRFVETLYDVGTTYNDLRPVVGGNITQVRTWLKLLASDSYGVIWLRKRGQRDEVGGFLVDKAEALRIIDTAILPPDDT